MRSLILSLFIIIGISAASAQSLLDSFSQNLAAMGCYKAKFAIVVDGQTVGGQYIVDGSNFYVAAEGVELYVADGVKYEVNSAKREVVVDSAASLGGDLLSNPAHCFDNLKLQFNATDSVEAGVKMVKLTPKEGSGESINIYADSRGELPGRIVYNFDNGSITILFASIAPYSAALPVFEQTRYAEYEVIDMR